MRKTRPTIETLRGADAGQAMAEFALVLPMLAILTFGTLEVALYLQQQSSINAAAFVAARAATVLGNNDPATRSSLGEYVDAAGMPWLVNASVVNEAKGRADYASYSVTASSDRMTGILAGLTNGQVAGFDTLAGGATLPIEYDSSLVRSTSHAKDPKYRPRTRSMLQYASTEDGKKSVLSGAYMNAATAYQALSALTQYLAMKPAPTPMPTSKPSGGGTKPPVKPPVTPATPVPKPTPVVELPPLPLSQGAEPITDRKPVVGNPKHRNDAGDDGRDEAMAQDYTGPLYEFTDDLKEGVPYKMKNVALDIAKFEDTLGKPGTPKTLETAAKRVGELVKTTKVNPAVAAGVKTALKGVTSAVKSLNQSLDKPTVALDKSEKALFSRKKYAP